MNTKTKEKLNEIFGIDLRSLALLRICIAILIIIDLISLLFEIKTFCSDEGLIPRSLLFWKLMLPWYFSFHVMSGTPLVQAVLLIIAGLFAVLLLVGYRTKFATIMSLVFITSLQIRIEPIIDGGDQWLRLMLFGCMFLPLGACYSIDSALNSSTEKLPKRILSGGTILLLGQFIIAYWTTGFLKLHNIAWTSGAMVYYALNYIEYATPLREALSQFLSIEHYKFLTYFVMWFWLIGPILLLSPILTPYFRITALMIFTITQLSLNLCMDIGPFSYKAIVASIPFLPSQVWDKLFAYLKTNERLNLKIYYDEKDDFCKKIISIIQTFFLLPETQLISSKSNTNIEKIIEKNNSWVVVDHKGENHTKLNAIKAICNASPLLYPLPDLFNIKFMSSLGTIIYNRISTSYKFRSKVETIFTYHSISPYSSKLSNILATVFLIYITLFTLEVLTNLDGINLKHKIKLPTNLTNIGTALYINQWWHMFVGYKGDDSSREFARWYTIIGRLKDGTEIDLFKNGGLVNWEKPKNLIKLYKNRLWAKYFFTTRGNTKLYFPIFTEYQCRKWNNKNKSERQIEEIKYYYNYQEIFLNKTFGEIHTDLVGQYVCPSK